MKESVDLVVVGAGIAGASTACLARAGLRVVVVDRGLPAGGASVVGGAGFAASPLAPFAIDREARGQEIRGEHEYEWGSFA
jgi:glycine/D-amino acid oxidase-like deaminating enzyme